MPQIRLEGVSKYYPQEKKMVPVVQNIDLTIRQGEYVFVIGSSGAGKSTLLRLISGELQPTRGSIYLDDVNLTRLTPYGRSRRRACIGWVPQTPQLVRKRTILENLEMVAQLSRSRRGSTNRERIRKALGMVGLKEVEDRYPAELSQGECRRVELARAILNSPSILVLDEVLANLDEDAIWDMLHLLGEFHRRGTTIIMATHAKKFVNLLRKRVITLVDGQIFGDVPRGRYGDVV